MIRAQRGVMPLFLLLVFEIAAIFALSALSRQPEMGIPWSRLLTWLEASRFEELLAPVLILGALVLSYWLLISTVLSMLAQLSRVPSAIRAIDVVTLPSVSRLVAGAVAASVGAVAMSGMIGGPVAFADQPSAVTGSSAPGAAPGAVTSSPGDGYIPTPKLKKDPKAESSTSTTSSTVASTPVEVEATPSTPSTPSENTQAPNKEQAAPSTPSTATGEYKVAPGDNLWKISRNELAKATGKPASSLSEGEIRGYWLKVIDVNKSKLRSGNPNLIYPGETLTLPSAK